MKTGLLMSLLHVRERRLALSTLEVKAIVEEVCGQRSQSFCRQVRDDFDVSDHILTIEG